MKYLLLFFSGLLLFSCQKEEDDTLQEYMYHKSKAHDYMSVDFNPSMFASPDAANLSNNERKALEGIEKLNVVAYHKDSIAPEFYKSETTKIKKLLSDPQYQELIHVSSGKDGGSVSFVGDENQIDELVIFGKHHENGFAIIRVIGDDMQPETVLALLKVVRERGFGIKELEPIQQAVDPTRAFKG